MAALLLVGLGFLLAGMVALASVKASRAMADALVNFFNPLILKIPFVGPALQRLITILATWIANKMGGLYEAHLFRLVNWFGGLAHYARMIADATLDWPIELVSFARWLLGRELPRLIHALPNSLTKFVHSLWHTLSSVESQVAKAAAHFAARVGKIAYAGLLGFLAPYIASIRYFALVWHRISHAASYAGGIAVPWIEVPRLRKDYRWLSKRQAKLWPLLGTVGAALLVERALQVVSGCVSKGNIGKAARRWCALDPRIVENLLAGLLVIVGTLDLRDFAKVVYELVGDAADTVRHFWRAEISGPSSNPDLGEIGAPPFLIPSGKFAPKNPGLGDIT